MAFANWWYHLKGQIGQWRSASSGEAMRPMPAGYLSAEQRRITR